MPQAIFYLRLHLRVALQRGHLLSKKDSRAAPGNGDCSAEGQAARALSLSSLRTRHCPLGGEAPISPTAEATSSPSYLLPPVVSAVSVWRL